MIRQVYVGKVQQARKKKGSLRPQLLTSYLTYRCFAFIRERGRRYRKAYLRSGQIARQSRCLGVQQNIAFPNDTRRDRDETRRKAFESRQTFVYIRYRKILRQKQPYTVYILITSWHIQGTGDLSSWTGGGNSELGHVLKTTPVLLYLTLETWHLLAYHRYRLLLLPSRPPNGEQKHLGTVRRCVIGTLMPKKRVSTFFFPSFFFFFL